MASTGLPDSPATHQRVARVAIVGNPNTGKSTLFNALAGMRVRTGNYPGVTISKKVGRFQAGDHEIDLIDLPGTYSLAPRSPDEQVAVEVLTGDLSGEPPIDAIICVVNATLLQRSLFLVSQVMELGKPTLIAVNMSDTAEARGLQIDIAKLSQNLQVPVVATSASKRTGIDDLRNALTTLLSDAQAGDSWSNTERERALPNEFYETCDQLRQELIQTACVPVAGDDANPDASSSDPNRSDASESSITLPDDYVLQRLLLDRGGESERQILDKLGAGILPAIKTARETLTAKFDDIVDMECSSRYTWAGKKLQGVLSQGGGSGGITDRLDSVVTHRVFGLFIFVALMMLVFQCIYAWAGYPMDWIDGITGFLKDSAESSLEPGIFRSLIVDGIIAGVGGVLIFVPQIALLFFFLAVLEDCGYMARAAFLVDRVMHLFGLSGKSFLPLMSSFACAIPGVMATRVIENRRDRFATMMIAPLMSCSARLPVYLLLIGAFIPATKVLGFLSLPALVLMAMYAVGVVVAIPVSLILKGTALKGETAPFVLELPEYQWPSVSVVFSRVWEAVREFVVRAGTLIFAASILIWFAGYWPGDHSRQFQLQDDIAQAEQQVEDIVVAQTELVGDAPAQQAIEDTQQAVELANLESTIESLSTEHQAESSRLLESSLLGKIGHGIEPIVKPLGWDWKIGLGALASFPAREVIISTLGTIYSLGGDVDEEDEGLMGAIRAAKWEDGTPVYSIPVALSVMVFFALCAQCVSTIFVIKRETNSWSWPIFSFVYMTVLAYIGSLLTYQIGTHFMGG